MTSIADLRKEYTLNGLSEASADANPFKQFEKWFSEAIAAALPEPNAMTLATATAAGKPSARIVLIKGFDEHGFIFYTNYESRKGRELTENPFASLVFHWTELERQVRIEGAVEKVAREISERYFHSRPAGSQLGAWASAQSRVVSGREELESNLAARMEEFEGKEILLPPFWGGYCVV
ncbi:MAG: pyridoxamine 5'-phosphate oxidase, partial [Rhizobacter sp.]|nr:pyridoxamine 5'-phosphate oxidase [Chlorobiales bacterium]